MLDSAWTPDLGSVARRRKDYDRVPVPELEEGPRARAFGPSRRVLHYEIYRALREGGWEHEPRPGHVGGVVLGALQPLLDEARASGCAILMLADHGHVLSDREHDDVVKAEDPDCPRYRELAESAVTGESELVLEGPNVYSKREGRRLALLYRESDRYKNLHHVGEHGGASLAEVVTPALLVAADDLHARVSDGSDEGLQTVEFPVTTWWQLELPTKKKRRLHERPIGRQNRSANPPHRSSR